MFEFTKRDEGYLVSLKSDGRTVADITTTIIGEVEQVKGGRIVVTPTKTVIRKSDWRIHFTATKLLPSQLKALSDEIDVLPE